MGLIAMIDPDLWTDELSREDSEAIFYDDDPVRQWERRVRESEVAALCTIALLLLRRDEEMWDAWRRY